MATKLDYSQLTDDDLYAMDLLSGIGVGCILSSTAPDSEERQRRTALTAERMAIAIEVLGIDGIADFVAKMVGLVELSKEDNDGE